MTTKKLIPFRAIMALAGMLLLAMGCTHGEPRQSERPPHPAAKMSPAGRENLERRTREANRLQELNQVDVENKISPYRYVTSTPRYDVFAQIIQASSHSRTIHSAGVTLLCPTNEAFEKLDNWKMLMRLGNQRDIDDFVANHIIPTIMTYDEFKSKDSHTTLAKTTIDIATRGGITANGAHVRSGHVSTENGYVIGLDEVVVVPRPLR